MLKIEYKKNEYIYLTEDNYIYKCENERVRLLGKEAQLLRKIIEKPNRVYSYEMLAYEIWDYEAMSSNDKSLWVKTTFNTPYNKLEKKINGIIKAEESFLERIHKVGVVCRALSVENVTLETEKNNDMRCEQSYVDCEHKLLNFLPSQLDSKRYIGREKEENELKTLINKGYKQIFVQGMAGIGKSELVIKVVTDLHLEEEYLCYYVEFKRSIKETILSLEFDNWKIYEEENNIRKHKTDQQQFDEKITLLKKYDRNCILIIDGFDCTPESNMLDDSDYRVLEQLNLICIFTTRTLMDREGLVLKSFSPNQLLKLMRNYVGKRYEDEELLRLIRYVESHTFTVDLIARLLRFNMHKLSPDDVLNILLKREETPKPWEKTVIDYKRTYKSRSFVEHLLTLYDLSVLEDEDKYVMCVASLVINDFIYFDLFLEIIGEDYIERVYKLSELGWLEYKYELNILKLPSIVNIICTSSNDTVIKRNHILMDVIDNISKINDIGKKEAKQLLSSIEKILAVVQDKECISFLYAISGKISRRNDLHYRARVYWQEKLLNDLRIMPQQECVLAIDMCNFGIEAFQMKEYDIAWLSFREALKYLGIDEGMQRTERSCGNLTNNWNECNDVYMLDLMFEKDDKLKQPDVFNKIITILLNKITISFSYLEMQIEEMFEREDELLEKQISSENKEKLESLILEEVKSGKTLTQIDYGSLMSQLEFDEEEVSVEVLDIDGKEYMLLISKYYNGTEYSYFSNSEDPFDICILKTCCDEEGEYFDVLDSEDEFYEVLSLLHQELNNNKKVR